MNELGAGFLESVYKNSLVIALQQKNIAIEVEQPFEVYFRGQKVGLYKADLVVEKTVYPVAEGDHADPVFCC